METDNNKMLFGSQIQTASENGKETLKNAIDELTALEAISSTKNAEPENTTMKTVLHKAASRGHANHGWLESHHSFSFASYNNPERMHFGVLRVLNDDQVAAGMGFGTHPHDNMEIISIPLEGVLEHKDSMGNVAEIKQGDIQVLSAGTGIYHSEYNKSTQELTKFLQIWVFPDTRNVTPRYDQLTLKPADRQNRLQQILSPNPDDEGVCIHQQAWFHLGNFDKEIAVDYQFRKNGNGVYAFVLEGSFEISGTELERRDAIGIWDANNIRIKSTSDKSQLLLMEVPMQIN